MILVDTSVWVSHLRSRNATLVRLLDRGEVLAHPFVIGELALGHLQPRDFILAELDKLPKTLTASYRETLHFIDDNCLFGRGVGYVDVHLLAATRLTSGARLWTHDTRLRKVADALGLAATP